jgi:ATP-binding cassette subfamily B protein
VLSAQVQERLAGMAVIRAYTMEAPTAAAFAEANGEYLRRTLALGRVQAWFSPLMGLVAGAGTLIVLWLGGRAVVEGRMTLGALVAFNGYLAYLAWPTIALGWTLSIVRRGLTSMERILEIVDGARTESDPGMGGRGAAPLLNRQLPFARSSPPAPHAHPDPADCPVGDPPSISFRNLTYGYDERGAVLHDVSFEVPAGGIVAVVGPTGSGKSTLGLVLTRLWEPPAGRVWVGGQDVTRRDLAELRALLAYVPQEAFLFSRSITDNVSLGREAIDGERVRAAALAAGVAAEVESFPQGFATVVGERGLTLSGGQRQRVALARALVGPAPLLVLDDVFASVDAAKEEEIVASLRRLRGLRTILLMTHRLRAAQTADRVVVLAGGRVVETGPHEALLAAGGLYARLWRRAQLEEEIARA